MNSIKGPVNIQGDVFCKRCGYNLRTLSIDALCPECFTPVAKSLQSDSLDSSSLPWLRKLHRGIMLLLISVVADLGLRCIDGILPISFVPDLLLAVLGYSVMLCYLCGLFWITVDDPSTIPSRVMLLFRRVCRISAVVSFLLVPLSSLEYTEWILPDLKDLMIPLCRFSTVLFEFGCVVACFWILLDLARRAGRMGLVLLSGVIVGIEVLIGFCRVGYALGTLNFSSVSASMTAAGPPELSVVRMLGNGLHLSQTVLSIVALVCYYRLLTTTIAARHKGGIS